MTDQRQVLTQGEMAVSADPQLVISTLLGSCVSCCLWDPLAQVGGINHMLVTQMGETGAQVHMSGVTAMEQLINEILQQGGVRTRLKAKVFGGAQMIEGLSDIGAANATFTLDYLEKEDIPCRSQSIGGRQARHLLFHPSTGVVRQRFVPNIEDRLTQQIICQRPNSSSSKL
jgi:chemotaxis protein CheD